ncbi:D-glycero-alpha-D-manno-heptose-1,7-bisphosphate 7-phosphatase [Desmospora profundinema]
MILRKNYRRKTLCIAINRNGGREWSEEKVREIGLMKKHKAVFLDRDGVLNEVKTDRVHFVNRPKKLYLLDGVPEAISLLRKCGYSIYIVTNQGGVGLGYMKSRTLDEIHKKLKRDLVEKNPRALIDDIAACTHKPQEKCRCRKPKPGMILSLAQKHDIDLSRSWMVGDRNSDMEAGKRAGCQTVKVTQGYSLLDFAEELYKQESSSLS